ncbi:MAG: DeoR/GlpR transcriptional regulator [Rhizobiales bacterium]|nr:DeoR/GlpR transcriptional regulator [Hyphomicrobiales bacterium]
MELTERQSDILAAARTRGRVSVDHLAADFQVTPQTIRRDLNDLCIRGLLSRVHGGAVPARSVSNVNYDRRRGLASAQKARIGHAAAGLIPENCSLILNIGTTTEQVARALYHHQNLVVVSNNINVINILSGSPGKELVLAGGTVRQADGGIVGEAAVEFIRQFKVDYAVIGASALDEDGAVLDYDIREVSVARTIIASARQTILVADASKFARTAPVRICEIGDVSTFVTDTPPPERFRKLCETNGIDVIVADGTEDRDENRT